MKKQHEHKIDELFDRTFGDFEVEPSERVWENITKQIPHANNFAKPGKSYFFNKYSYFFYAAAASVAIITILYFSRSDKSKHTINKTDSVYINEQKTVNEPDNKINNAKNINSANDNYEQKENNSVKNTANANKTINLSNDKSLNNTPLKPALPVKSSNKNTYLTQNKTKNTTKNNSLKSNNYTEKEKVVTEKNVSNKENISSGNGSASNIGQINDNNIKKSPESNTVKNSSSGSNSVVISNENITANNTDFKTNNNTGSKSDMLSDKPENISKIKSLKAEHIPVNFKPVINSAIASVPEQANNPQYFSPRIYPGIHYTPEWFFNLPENNSPVNSKEKKFNQNIQISFNYDYKNIIIQSGIGLSLYNNETSSGINYISRDSVGYYNDVISYTYDSTTNTIIFNTNLINVYDSINHSLYQSTKNHYSYIQIPFTIGYRKYIKRFSFTVRGGAGLGILSYKKESLISFNNENATILSIERYTPTLTKTYWQFLLSVGCGYQFNDNIFITAEPVFKYYLSPFYDQKDVKKYPYSIGFKTGLYYRF